MGRLLGAIALAGFFVAVIADVGWAVAVWEFVAGLVIDAAMAFGGWIAPQLAKDLVPEVPDAG